MHEILCTYRCYFQSPLYFSNIFFVENITVMIKPPINDNLVIFVNIFHVFQFLFFMQSFHH